jgi:hypothetical protein
LPVASDPEPALPAPAAPASALDAAVTAAGTQQVDAVIRRCAPLGRERRSGTAWLDADIVIEVHAQHATIHQVNAHVHGLQGSLTAALQRCVDQRVAGLEVAAQGAPDLDTYRITERVPLR